MDTLFFEGLKENDIEKLLSVPKSDLHNHSTKGCRREWLAEQLHAVIPEPPKQLNGLEGMQNWFRTEIKPFFVKDIKIWFFDGRGPLQRLDEIISCDLS